MSHQSSQKKSVTSISETLEDEDNKVSQQSHKPHRGLYWSIIVTLVLVVAAIAVSSAMLIRSSLAEKSAVSGWNALITTRYVQLCRMAPCFAHTYVSSS